MWNSSQASESGAWQRMITRSCSILWNRQNWLQISSVNCMKGPPWLFPETTVPPNSFSLGIASPLGNHRGPRALLVQVCETHRVSSAHLVLQRTDTAVSFEPLSLLWKLEAHRASFLRPHSGEAWSSLSRMASVLFTHRIFFTERSSKPKN